MSLFPALDHVIRDLEVLVVFAVFPAAAPFEAVLGKGDTGKILFIDLHGEVTAAVYIGGAGSWLDQEVTVYVFHVGVIERIDVDGNAHAVLGDFRGMGDEAEVEGGAVVVGHGSFIVGVVVIDEADLLDGIFGGIELFEDGEDGFCDAAVDHHFAVLRFPLEIHMAEAEVGELFSGDGAVRLE